MTGENNDGPRSRPGRGTIRDLSASCDHIDAEGLAFELVRRVMRCEDCDGPPTFETVLEVVMDDPEPVLVALVDLLAHTATMLHEASGPDSPPTIVLLEEIAQHVRSHVSPPEPS